MQRPEGDAGGGRYDGRVIEFTQWAIDILRRSHEAARRFNPEATVRVFRSDGGVQFVLMVVMIVAIGILLWITIAK